MRPAEARGTDAPAVEVNGLTVSYGSTPVLWDVDVAFPAGRLSAVVGPNGAGKSTLLRAVLGLVPASSGRVRVTGLPLEQARHQVAYVPQTEVVDWDFPISVAEVVEMGRYRSTGWFRRVGRADRASAAEALDRVGMTPYARRQIGALSGGQRRRVFVARALAQQAPVLLMDEPLAGVDARTQAAMLGLFGDLRDEGYSIVVVHHDLPSARRAFDFALLLDVRAVASGPPGSTLSQEQLDRAYGAPSSPDGSSAPGALPWAG